MGFGAEGLDDYEPPSVRVAERLAGQADPAAARRDRIAEVAAMTDGEVG